MTVAEDRVLKDIALDCLEPHPKNRRHFNADKIAELAVSLKTVGVLTPLVVRAGGTDVYQIIAGERRWRAARAAGLTHVPCVVRDLTDDEAIEVLLTENLQREDPHPIEEAETYAAYLELGHDVRELAAKVGKSVAHVYSRLQLRSLSEKARDLVWTNGLPIGHALILARVPAAQQDLVLEALEKNSYHGTPTLVQFTRTVTSAGLTLEDAPFDRNDAGLCPQAGSCTACPKRLHFADGMFPELAAEIQKAGKDGDDLSARDAQLAEDKCLDPACWSEKTEAFLAQAIEQARETYGEELVLLSGKDGQSYPSKASAPLPRGLWKVVKKKDRGAVPGIYVKEGRFSSDEKLGEVLWVTLKARPKDGATPAAAPSRDPDEDYQERYRKEQAERKARIEKEQPRRLALASAIVAKVPSKLNTDLVVEIALDYFQPYDVEQAGKLLKVKAPKKVTAKSSPREVMLYLTLGLANGDIAEHACGQKDGTPDYLLALAQRFGVDSKKVLLAHDATVKAKEKKVVA